MQHLQLEALRMYAYLGIYSQPTPANSTEQKEREDKYRIQMDLLLKVCMIHNVDLLNSIQVSSKKNKDAHTKKKAHI